MPKFIELTGNRYGHLTVVRLAGRMKNSLHWECGCECGRVVLIRGQALREGEATNCGCLTPRGQGFPTTVNGRQTREYHSYRGMLGRCYDERHPFFHAYGGRGIRVCSAWLSSFVHFRREMGERPPGTSLDRKNTNGDYVADNCRWATRAEQARNKRTTKFVTVRGVSMPITDWKTFFGLSSSEGLSAAALEAVVAYLDAPLAEMIGVTPEDLKSLAGMP